MNAGNKSRLVEDLVEMLQDANPLVRVQAGFALGTLRENALPALPILVEMLKFGDIQDRKLAAITLGQIGPAASQAVPELQEAFDYDYDDGVAHTAMWALENIGVADNGLQAEAA